MTCLGAIDFGDVVGSAFFIGDMYGLHKSRLLTLKHYLLVMC